MLDALKNSEFIDTEIMKKLIFGYADRNKFDNSEDEIQNKQNLQALFNFNQK